MAKQNKAKPKYVREEEVTREFLSINKALKLTEKQKALIKQIVEDKIVIVTGPAGTSKTFVMCHAAAQLLKRSEINKIILCKPTVIVSGSVDLGALPGSLEEKTDVYAESFYSNFAEIIPGHDLKMLRDTKVIEFKPVQYQRGCTFNNALILVDEFQNFHINELMTIVTRMGRDTKIVFAGDIRQNDIPGKFVSVEALKKLLHGLPGTSSFEFERKDIMRDPLLIEIIDRFEQMENNGELPQKKN
jgi:phosphate starvation-inducible PhoH-like protein